MGSATLPTITSVITAAASVFDVTVEDLTGPGRSVPLVPYRQAAIAAARHLTGASYPSLGRAFGGRDHTTVMHQCTRANPILAAAVVDEIAGVSSPSLRAEVEELRAEVARLAGDLRAALEAIGTPKTYRERLLRLAVDS